MAKDPQRLTETLDSILDKIRHRHAMEELAGGPTHKAPCKSCDGTGWEMLTVGRVTTAGGMDVQATVYAPVAQRCPKGCWIPVKGVRRESRQAPQNREMRP